MLAVWTKNLAGILLVLLADEVERSPETGGVSSSEKMLMAWAWPFRPPVAVAVAVKSGLMVSMKSSSTTDLA